MNPIEKTRDYYRRLPYTLHVELVSDPDDGVYWIAEYVELRGCKTDGSTEAEAINNLYELFDEYVLTKLENGIQMPEPTHVPVTVQPWKVVLQRQTPITADRPDVDTHETRSETKYEEVGTAA
jgi:predicted RNase H-like HicB family nuclease